MHALDNAVGDLVARHLPELGGVRNDRPYGKLIDVRCRNFFSEDHVSDGVRRRHRIGQDVIKTVSEQGGRFALRHLNQHPSDRQKKSRQHNYQRAENNGSYHLFDFFGFHYI